MVKWPFTEYSFFVNHRILFAGLHNLMWETLNFKLLQDLASFKRSAFASFSEPWHDKNESYVSIDANRKL